MDREGWPTCVATLISIYRGDRVDRVERALQSILQQQDLGPCRVIVHVGLDGPVDPDVRALVDGYAARGAIRLTVFEKNRGVAPVVNDLLKNLDDEPFVFRLDADDEAFPDRFFKQISYFLDHPEVDVLGTAMLESRFDGQKQVVRFSEGHDAIVQGLYWRVAVANPTVAFRRRVLDETGGYPVQNLSEDLAMWFLCAVRGYRFANIPEPLVQFNVDQNFLQRRGLKRAWREYIVWTKGVLELYGFGWRLLGPVARLLFRLVPRWILERAYRSSLRGTSQA